jgi:hypothetical protein
LQLASGKKNEQLAKQGSKSEESIELTSRRNEELGSDVQFRCFGIVVGAAGGKPGNSTPFASLT